MHKAPLSKIAYEKIVAAGNALLQQVFPSVCFGKYEWEVKHTRNKVRVLLFSDYITLSYTIKLKTTSRLSS
jgi:hypothetical protein